MGQPGVGGVVLAGRTVAIAAGMVAVTGRATGRTTVELAAQRLSAAPLDRLQRVLLAGFVSSTSWTACRKAFCRPLSSIGEVEVRGSPVALGLGNSQVGLRWVRQCVRNRLSALGGSGT